MSKTAPKKTSRLSPRLLGEHAWYYVDKSSIDLFVESINGSVPRVRLSRKQLTAMLAELRPVKR